MHVTTGVGVKQDAIPAICHGVSTARRTPLKTLLQPGFMSEPTLQPVTSALQSLKDGCQQAGAAALLTPVVDNARARQKQVWLQGPTDVPCLQLLGWIPTVPAAVCVGVRVPRCSPAGGSRELRPAPEEHSR
jgi:hypothetical protein